jgi:hypothetical protein
MSPSFAGVQKVLQNSVFALAGYRECSPLFVWVGVLLVYQAGVREALRAIHRSPPCKPPSSTWTLRLVRPTRSTPTTTLAMSPCIIGTLNSMPSIDAVTTVLRARRMAAKAVGLSIQVTKLSEVNQKFIADSSLIIMMAIGT